MKKVLTLILPIMLCFSMSVNAFELIGIRPDDSYIIEGQMNVDDDIRYLDEIVDEYRTKYVVKRCDFCDISEIDRFYEELSKPMEL